MSNLADLPSGPSRCRRCGMRVSGDPEGIHTCRAPELLTELEKEVAFLRRTLENIAEPLEYLQFTAESEGRKLNTAVAVQMADSHLFLKDTARAALKAKP